VGIAGRGLDLTIEHKRTRGVRDRLDSHWWGRRSGDQFAVYVCDRLVLPQLTPSQISQIAAGDLSLDALTRVYIHQHLSYPYASLCLPVLLGFSNGLPIGVYPFANKFSIEIASAKLGKTINRSQGDRRNPFYESMREVSPGDLVFSFFDTRIFGIGIATSNCYVNPRPSEFGGAGMYWDRIGWKIRVNFFEMQNKIRPKDHMAIFTTILPVKYSPLQASGNGNQGIYLTELSPEFVQVLIGLALLLVSRVGTRRQRAGGRT
jgi:hypothetical protein